ncbi:MAG: D-alanine--D-alanine ligase [Chitinophagaceae bacterium]|nr:D-alanine--D-alanine ligase [Chitinophagaceae bacterium]
MKKKIALVTGGYSGEATISYLSAETVGNNIDTEKYDVYKIDIALNGWFYIAPDGNKIPVDRSDFTIPLKEGKIKFDAALMCIHGTPGEDGKLQGYFDLLHIPYTSCDAAVAALTFNKRYTVAVAAFSGVCVAKSVLLLKGRHKQPEELVKHLHFPVFVKPNNGGSSIAMSKVNAFEELGAAIEKAFGADNQVLVEECIHGREFTVGVLYHQGKYIPLPISEIIPDTSRPFFDFEAKYQGKSQEITPAQADKTITEKVQQTAVKVCEALNTRGVVRIDFIYNEAQGEPYMLEVNTVPGQSHASIVPQQVAANGWALKDFYSMLLENCFDE